MKAKWISFKKAYVSSITALKTLEMGLKPNKQTINNNNGIKCVNNFLYF